MGRPKIIVLDGHTANPDDLSWEGLSEFGELSVFPRTPDDEVISRTRDAQIVILNKIRMTRQKIEELPDLRYIGLLATGFDNVDLDAASENNIIVSNVPAYGTPSVAQHAFALLLQLTNRVALHDRSVHDMDWVRSEDFSYFKKPLTEISDKTLGILGYGQIGRAVARIARAFGMHVIVYSDHSTTIEGADLVGLDDLFRQSDVLTIHSSLTEDRMGIVNSERLSLMKSTAIVINTSRGGFIREHDLAEALNNGIIGGAALDVLTSEPPDKNNPLLFARNCVITPHISWVTIEARKRLMQTVVDNVRAFIQGNPIHVVS